MLELPSSEIHPFSAGNPDTPYHNNIMADIDKLENMRLPVLDKLRDEVRQNLDELISSKNGRLNSIAWLARNILELTTWSAYCAESEENSKQFVLDAVRDVNDVLNVPEGIYAADFDFRAIRQENIDKAEADGFTSLDDNFTAVINAAKKLGRGDDFKYRNKLFSKFAHPTALSVIYQSKEIEATLKSKFYAVGIRMAEGTIRYLDEAIAKG